MNLQGTGIIVVATLVKMARFILKWIDDVDVSKSIAECSPSFQSNGQQMYLCSQCCNI